MMEQGTPTMASMVDSDDRRAYWNERYAAQGDVFGATPNEFVEAELASAPLGRALDLGCGQGRNAVWLASLGHDVTGVDQSDVAIEHAHAAAAQAGVDIDFVVADLVNWEPTRASTEVSLPSLATKLNASVLLKFSWGVYVRSGGIPAKVPLLG